MKPSPVMYLLMQNVDRLFENDLRRIEWEYNEARAAAQFAKPMAKPKKQSGAFEARVRAKLSTKGKS